MNKVIECRSVSKHYVDSGSMISVLSDVDFSIQPGEHIAIVGPSGTGKSTFLHLLGGLDRPTSGQILAKGQDWQKLSEHAACKLRNASFGFIYQFHHLLSEFSALENVMMPLLLKNRHVHAAKTRAAELLDVVGLSERLNHKPSMLSGGERQRVAIARALVHQPHCVFADEPTGNLDEATAAQIFDLMISLNKKMNASLIMVTHDLRLAKKMDAIYCLSEGRLGVLKL